MMKHLMFFVLLGLISSGLYVEASVMPAVAAPAAPPTTTPTTAPPTTTPTTAPPTTTPTTAPPTTTPTTAPPTTTTAPSTTTTGPTVQAPTYMVSIQEVVPTAQSHVCTGFVYPNKTIVTSGKCTHTIGIGNYIAVIGSNSPNVENSKTANVSHSIFSPNGIDIAVLRLDKNLTGIQHVNLATSAAIDGCKLHYYEKSDESNNLQYKVVDITLSECSPLEVGVLCSAPIEAKLSEKDYGAPLICKDNLSGVLIDIGSDSSRVVKFTDVTPIKDWIQEVTPFTCGAAEAFLSIKIIMLAIISHLYK